MTPNDPHRQSPEPMGPEDEQNASLLVEFWWFLKENKKWWLIPLIIIFLLLGAAIFLSHTPAAPFIYTIL